MTESSKKNEAFRQKKEKSVGELDIGRISLDNIGEKENVSGVEQSALKSVEETVNFSRDSQEKQKDIDIIKTQKALDDEELDNEERDGLKGKDHESNAYNNSKKLPASHIHTRSSGNRLSKGTGGFM